MWGFRLSSDIWLCSVAVITPDSDIRTFRQPRFESWHDLAVGSCFFKGPSEGTALFWPFIMMPYNISGVVLKE